MFDDLIKKHRLAFLLVDVGLFTLFTTVMTVMVCVAVVAVKITINVF